MINTNILPSILCLIAPHGHENSLPELQILKLMIVSQYTHKTRENINLSVNLGIYLIHLYRFVPCSLVLFGFHTVYE